MKGLTDDNNLKNLIACFVAQKVFAEHVITTLEQAQSDKQKLAEQDKELQMLRAREKRRLSLQNPDLEIKE